jgi:hypothetical protein
MKSGFPSKLHLTFCLLLLAALSSFAQNTSDGFTKVRPNRWAPNLVNWHEFYSTAIIATDLDFEWDGDYDTSSILFGPPDDGNLALGVNYGFGGGYRFKLGSDVLPQSLGLGMRAEIYPNMFAKYAITIDAKLLAFGTNEMFVSVIGGGELNISTHLPSKTTEFRSSMYLVDARYKQWEFMWALQSYSDFWFENQFIDEAFSVYRINYVFIK